MASFLAWGGQVGNGGDAPMPAAREQPPQQEVAFPVKNTSVTDLLDLLEKRWFGCDAGEAGQTGGRHDPDPPPPPALSRRGSASQLSSGRQSSSSERLLVGSGDASMGAVVLSFPPATPNEAAHNGEARSARLPPASQQQQQQHVQAARMRSEPLAAAGGYEPSSGLLPAAANGGKPGGDPKGPALGTWAHRQRVFLQQQASKAAAGEGLARAPPIAEEDGGAGPSTTSATAAGYMCLPPSGEDRAAAAEAALAEATGRGRGGAANMLGHQRPDSVDDEDELNAAWRWRFARKWQTEQAKQFDPDYGKEGGDDEWGDALGYMDALAGGLNLQIARTVSSTDQYASLPLMSPTLSQSMLLDASIKESPLTSTIDDPSSMNATKHIVAVARRAQQLLQQQQEIERQVEQRWESATAGQPWVGQHLPAVTVDSWGRFPFVLVRLLDRSSRHKVLVRGKNGAEEAALFSQLEQEVSRAAVQHRLPGPRLELLGSGLMEWSRERDRCLNVTATKLHSLNDARLRSKADVSKLAGALAQSSLPVTYKILVEGLPPSGKPQG